MTSTSKTVYVATQTLNCVVPLLEVLLPEVQFEVVTFENSVAGVLNTTLKITDVDVDKLKESEILLTDFFVIGQLMYRLPKLQWLQTCSAGVDTVATTLTPDVIAERGVPSFTITRFSGDLYASLMFEYCMCFIINIERGFIGQIRMKSTHNWFTLKAQSPKSYRMVRELTIAILGIGSIGSLVAQQFQKQGARVLGFGRTDRSGDELTTLGLDYYSTNISQVLTTCDYIISILPHTPETIALLNGKFSACQNSPVFINLGRGSVVQSDYLIQSLDLGEISYAILDVFEEEPLPETSPLWQHEKVCITPHVSCETRPQDLAKVFVENFHLYEQNKEMNYKVDWTQRY